MSARCKILPNGCVCLFGKRDSVGDVACLRTICVRNFHNHPPLERDLSRRMPRTYAPSCVNPATLFPRIPQGFTFFALSLLLAVLILRAVLLDMQLQGASRTASTCCLGIMLMLALMAGTGTALFKSALLASKSALMAGTWHCGLRRR